MAKRKVCAAGKTARVTFDGFSFGAKAGKLTGVAKECENCEIVGGELRTGAGGIPRALGDFGVVKFTGQPTKIGGIFPLREKENDVLVEKVGFITTSGMVFVYDTETQKTAGRYAFGLRMLSLIARDGEGNFVTFFYGEKGAYIHGEEGIPSSFKVNKASFAGCFFRGRVFLAQLPHTLLYSAPYAPTDFSETLEESGKIDLPEETGEIVGLVPMRDTLYVFYEHGISMVELGGGAREFRVEKLAYNGGRIFGDSAAVCAVGEENIFFLAEDGLYAFDGTTAERVCEELPITPIAEGQLCGHATFDGKYFLKYIDADGTERSLIVDGKSKEGYFAFVPMGLDLFDGRGVCIFDGVVHTLSVDGDLPEGGRYVFTARRQAFGEVGGKSVKELQIEGVGETEVCIGNGKREKTFSVDLGLGSVARLRPRLFGEEFSLRFVLKKGACVRKVTVVTERCAGVREEV